jgi:hypothetical protein
MEDYLLTEIVEAGSRNGSVNSHLVQWETRLVHLILKEIKVQWYLTVRRVLFPTQKTNITVFH